MADRPAALFKWVSNHPAGKIEDMWKDLFPDNIDDDTKHLWYHDLHWLINEGFVILFSDGTLHAAKELDKPAVKSASKKTEKLAKTDKKEETPKKPEE